MRNSTIRRLRAAFIPVFGPGDNRNLNLWRRLKREYNAVPGPARPAYLAELAWQKTEWQKTGIIPTT